jgi:hypothetical protein
VIARFLRRLANAVDAFTKAFDDTVPRNIVVAPAKSMPSTPVVAVDHPVEIDPELNPDQLLTLKWAELVHPATIEDDVPMGPIQRSTMNARLQLIAHRAFAGLTPRQPGKA